MKIKILISIAAMFLIVGCYAQPEQKKVTRCDVPKDYILRMNEIVQAWNDVGCKDCRRGNSWKTAFISLRYINESYYNFWNDSAYRKYLTCEEREGAYNRALEDYKQTFGESREIRVKKLIESRELYKLIEEEDNLYKKIKENFNEQVKINKAKITTTK